MIFEFSVAMNVILLAMLVIWTIRIEILKQYRRDHMAKITELQSNNSDLLNSKCPLGYTICPLQLNTIEKEGNK